MGGMCRWDPRTLSPIPEVQLIFQNYFPGFYECNNNKKSILLLLSRIVYQAFFFTFSDRWCSLNRQMNPE